MKINSSFGFLKIVMMLLCCMIFIPSFPSYGHLYGLNYQEWKNQKNDIRIQFDITPSTPTTGENSTMNFTVQNLKTGQHLKEFNETVTIINPKISSTPNGLVHKFKTTTIHGTDFSQDYIFPSGGTFYILIRIDAPNVINIAKFQVFVSSPQFQFLNFGHILFPVIIVIGLFAAILITVAYYIYRKK